MNGPEHYRDAEYLLNKVPTHGINPDTGLDRAETLAAAQVHATLALTAATANTTHHESTRPLADTPGPWSNGHNGDGLTWEEALR